MLRNNLLVEPLTKEQRGALVMPSSVKDDWLRGRVVEAGQGKYSFGKIQELEVQVGDVVIYAPNPYGEYPSIVVDGLERIILTEDDIYGVE